MMPTYLLLIVFYVTLTFSKSNTEPYPLLSSSDSYIWKNREKRQLSFSGRSDYCTPLEGSSGSIKYNSRQYNDNQKCWKLYVPQNKVAHLKFISFSLPDNCDASYVEVRMKYGSDKQQKFCSSNAIEANPIEAFDDVEIFYYKNRNYGYNTYSFELSYLKEDILCRRTDSFRCEPESCISRDKICDDVKDCINGADEVGCEKGVSAVEGIKSIRNDTLNWLKENRNAEWGWNENTHRAVVALHLAGGVDFSSNERNATLMAKQLQLQLATGLLRNGTQRITPTQLSMYINALLVICCNPRNFYGFDLIKRLRNEVDSLNSENEHPLPYLALCNAGEIPSNESVEKLFDITQTSSEQNFLMDVQALAIMALTCITNNEAYFHLKPNVTLKTNALKKKQLDDGSFGNIYTTALVMQALFANGHEEDKDWKLKTAIEYLKKNQDIDDKSFGHFLAASLILPVLNGKSLTDVGKINCTESMMRPRDGNPVSDIHHKLGSKISSRYFLYIGAEKEIVHQISLRVPGAVTVFDIMRLAEQLDPKYKFKFIETNNKVYIYEIADIANDPEDGNFWLLHLTNNGTIYHEIKSPNKVAVKDEQDVIMWYKPTDI